MKNYIIKNVAIILASAMMLGTVGCVTLDVGEDVSSDPSVVSTADIILPSETEDETSSVDEPSSTNKKEESVTTKKATTKKAATTTKKKTTTTKKAATTTKKKTTTTKKATTTTKKKTTTKKTTTTTKKKTTTTTKKATTTTKKTTTTTKATTTTVSADQKKEYANYWLSYAKKYAKSIGLEVRSGRDGAYDTPLGVEYPSSNTNIKNNIEGSLRDYKSQGSTAVYLWLDTKLNNKYQLYIGYN